MKSSNHRLDKVEEALIAAHRRQEDLQLPPEWRQQVLEDIKSQPKPAAFPQQKEGMVVISIKKIKLVAALSLAVLVGWLVLANIDRIDPWVSLKLEKAAHASQAAFRLEAGDNESGLRNLKVTVIQKEIKIEVLAKDFEPRGGLWYPTSDVVKKVNIPLVINTQKLGLQEGEVTIIIVAHDLSWSNGFAGNETTLKKIIHISHDNKP
jgi:hypothetical protein